MPRSPARNRLILLGLCALCSVADIGCKRPSTTGPGGAGWLEFFGGFASPSDGLLLARAHRGAPDPTPQPGESRARRVQETLESLEADPLRDIALSIRLGDRPPIQVRSNDRGYVELAPLLGLVPPQVTVRLDVLEPHYQVPAIEGALPVYDSQPGLGVITDIDDTLLDTGVVDKLKLAQQAVTRSTWELQAFPDAAARLTALSKDRPLFYVSGSPWGFYSRIHGYFARTGFPVGTLLLKRFSSEPLFDQMAFKWGHIARVVDALPQKRWLLLGDSGEKDPEIYARLRRERPDRVEAIFIHLVTPEDPQSPRFAGMRVFRAWAEVSVDSGPASPATPSSPASPSIPSIPGSDRSGQKG